VLLSALNHTYAISIKVQMVLGTMILPPAQVRSQTRKVE